MRWRVADTLPSRRERLREERPQLEAERIQHDLGVAAAEVVQEDPAVIELADRERRRPVLMRRAAGEPPTRT
jgi:hypothetical protein